jgi:hypothetical protein
MFGRPAGPDGRSRPAQSSVAASPVAASPDAATAGWRRRSGLTARVLCVAFAAGLSSGCYTNVPLAATIVTGQEVVLGVNDQGRVALGETLGGSVSRISGRVESRTDSAFVLSVTGVDYLNGLQTKWSGEKLTVNSRYVGQTQERKFSRSRTFLAAAIGAGLLAAFILTRSIIGGESPKSEGGDGGGGATS